MTEFKRDWLKTFDDTKQPASNVVYIGVDLAKPGADRTVECGWTIGADGVVEVRVLRERTHN